MSSTPTPDGFTAMSRTTGDAWAAWNASYHEPNGDVYRTLGQALYMQAWHERITAQFARLDEQNALLDAILTTEAARARGDEYPRNAPLPPVSHVSCDPSLTGTTKAPEAA